MSAEELRELVVFITERVMGLMRRPETAQRALLPGEYDIIFKDRILLHTSQIFNPITNDADAMAVMRACYEKDRNDYFAAFHNFLIRKDHDRSFTPLQICLFARKLHGG